VTTRPVRDFDLHPDEDSVRVFTSGPDGVLRFSGDAYVAAARYGDIVLWHYAFAQHWFKVNLTTDLAGHIVETGDEHSGRFAFNCDIATPMRRHAGAVFAVDLFADVLVRADSLTYQVCDLEELERARRSGLVLPAEARGARSGLAELTGIIERGDLLAFMSQACAIGPLEPPPATPPGRAPLAQVPLLGIESRRAWLGHDELPHPLQRVRTSRPVHRPRTVEHGTRWIGRCPDPRPTGDRRCAAGGPGLSPACLRESHSGSQYRLACRRR
jgi:hypothetical protein